MATWKVESEGRHWFIDAPEDVTEKEVNEFAAANADSWVNGARYKMEPDTGEAAAPAKPEKTQRNKEAEAAVKALTDQIKVLEEQLAEAQKSGRVMEEAPGGAVVGMRPKGDVAGLKAQIESLKAQRERFQVGTTGQTVGGMAGALVGGGTGAVAGGLIAGPPGALMGGILGSIIGGAAGAGTGTHLWDIPEAQQAIDISDQEAADLIRSRMVESLLWDGAFVLIFGPGGRLIGKMRNGQKFGPALKASAKESFGWDQVKGAKQAQMEKVIEKRVEVAPPGLATEASRALGVAKAEEPATREVIADIAQRSGGNIPTKGEVSGIIGPGETFARAQSPKAFVRNDKLLAETAESIRRGALSELDKAEAYGSIELGEAVSRVTGSANRTLKRETGPIFDRAAQQNVFVDMRPTLDYVEEILKKDTASAKRLITRGADRESLIVTRDSLKANPMMTPEAAQDFISGNKLAARTLDSGGQKPDAFMQKVLGEMNESADAAFLRSLASVGDPNLTAELVAARNLYRTTLADLYSDTMVAMARKNPEDIGRAVTSKGSITEIREMRAALVRALENAPAKSRYRGGVKPENLTELGKEAMLRERTRIDAGLTKGFLEKNTLSLEDLGAKMKDPDFRVTLKELLMGKDVADPKLGQKILDELDRTLAVIKLASPEAAPKPGRIGIGPIGSVGAGTVAGALTGGSIQAAVGVVVAAVITMRFLGHAMATAMTTGNTGVFRTLQRAISLSRAAGKNAAAAEALRGALGELDEWSRRNGGPGLDLEGQEGPAAPASAINMAVRG